MKITIAAILVLIAVAASADAPGFLGVRAKKGENMSECVIVEDLAPGGPAQRSGLLRGDAIITIDGVAVECNSLQKGTPIAPGIQAGSRIVFGVLRAGKKVEIPVVADAIPTPSGLAHDEHARLSAGREIFNRLIKTQEVFSVTLLEGDAFAVSGKMTKEEAQLLHYYLDEKFGRVLFSGSMKTKTQDMYLRFDRESAAIRIEFVDSTDPARL